VSRELAAGGRVAQRDPDDKARAAGPRHVTGYLGLNPGSPKEAKSLKGTSRQQVLVSLNDGDTEKRFADNPGMLDFIFGELGYSVGDVRGWMNASAVLFQADPNLREQLADVMRWMRRAEKGEIVVERLVLSGHSNGVELWGDTARGIKGTPGKMLIDRDLGNLARAFPTAAGQVEDIMFSACFSLNAVEIVRKAFPNLKSVWSYGGWSPEIDDGSQQHISTWSKATEGGQTPKKSSARGSTALWTRDKGYIVGDPKAAAAGPLYADALRLWHETGEPMFLGEKDFPEPQLRPLYQKAQTLRANPDADGMAKGWAEHTIMVVLRLRFWTKIRAKFGEVYGQKLQPSYDKLGIAAPDWATLTRVRLKAHKEAVENALDANMDPKAREPIAELLFGGLWALDDTVIKADWI
jgi:hypothetical protein